MNKSKTKTVLECHEIAKKVCEVSVPWEVYRMFGSPSKMVFIWGDQISLGEDFGSLEECRNAVKWYVEQLGGEVKWPESK